MIVSWPQISCFSDVQWAVEWLLDDTFSDVQWAVEWLLDPSFETYAMYQMSHLFFFV